MINGRQFAPVQLNQSLIGIQPSKAAAGRCTPAYFCPSEQVVPHHPPA